MPLKCSWRWCNDVMGRLGVGGHRVSSALATTYIMTNVWLALGIYGCGGDGLQSAGDGFDAVSNERSINSDASLGTSSEDIVHSVGDVEDDANLIIEPLACDVPLTFESGTCGYTGFKSCTSEIPSLIPGQFRYVAQRQLGDRYDRLALRLRHGGIHDGANGPGDYDFAGSYYDSCDNCLTISRDCSEDDGCAQVFFATEGIMHVTKWDGEHFAVSFEDVVLVEVSIDNTIAVVPVQGGETWCLHDEQFEADIPRAEAAPIDGQASCVEEGTGSFLGHNVANFSLPNCLGQQVGLHEGCGETKALWLMGTTGWCTACSITLNQMAEEHGGLLTRAALTEATPGLDMLIVLSENADYEPPTQAYCEQYALAHNLDPAMVLLDYDELGVEVSLIDPPGATQTFKQMATVWSHINPYQSEVEAGLVRTVYPWNALLSGESMTYYWSDYVDVSNLNAATYYLLSE
jgi:hypothetical protein